jgi:stearoyl-CoA desaturase (delta-9 desaturase)
MIEAPQTPNHADTHIEWRTVIPLVAVHLLPLGAIWTGVTAFDLWLCFGLYVTRMFFVTAGYHRLLAHNSYRTSRWFRFALLFGAVSSGQGGPLWWAGWHRHHHNHADTDADLHAPAHGFWHAHLGWMLSSRHSKTPDHLVGDLARDPALVWLDTYHFVPPLLLAALVWGLFGLSALLIGVFLSTALLYHGTFFINSLTHRIGTQRFDTGDESRNSWVLALITLGEGWHNNHHHRPSACRQGVRWYELDITWLVLKVFGALGLVWGMRR